jgi:hypothetical protein
MKRNRWLGAAVAGMTLLTFGSAARALINVPITVQSMHDDSQAVFVGAVTSVNADNRVVEVKVKQAVKGDSPGDTIKIQIANPPDLIKQVAADAPVVVFVSQKGNGALASIHLADTWLLAEAIPNTAPTAWRTKQVADIRESFPGRTGALVGLLAEIKAGKPTLLNETKEEVFGGIIDLGKLPVTKPTFLLAADVNGDKKLDLLVGTAEGVKLFLAADAGYEDATEKWGLAGVKAAHAAIDSVHAYPQLELLLDRTRWVKDGSKFKRQDQALGGGSDSSGELAGIALWDTSFMVDVAREPDAIFLSAKGGGECFTPGAAKKTDHKLWGENEKPPASVVIGNFDNDLMPSAMVVRPEGLTRYAFSDAGGPPADFERLTGKRLREFRKEIGDDLKGVIALALDVNGDRRPDLLLAGESGGILLVNRGFGAFMVNKIGPAALYSKGTHTVPFKLTPAIAWTAVDWSGNGCQGILILTEDGRLFRVDAAAPTTTAAASATSKKTGP